MPSVLAGYEIIVSPVINYSSWIVKYLLFLVVLTVILWLKYFLGVCFS